MRIPECQLAGTAAPRNELPSILIRPVLAVRPKACSAGLDGACTRANDIFELPCESGRNRQEQQSQTREDFTKTFHAEAANLERFAQRSMNAVAISS